MDINDGTDQGALLRHDRYQSGPHEMAAHVSTASQSIVSLLLTGDVMTGRGVDQILPHPGDPMVHEGYATSALDYVALAERAHGPIPRPVAFDYVWGDGLAET